MNAKKNRSGSPLHGLVLDVALAVAVFGFLFLFAKVTNKPWSWGVAAALALGVVIGGMIREFRRRRWPKR